MSNSQGIIGVASLLSVSLIGRILGTLISPLLTWVRAFTYRSWVFFISLIPTCVPFHSTESHVSAISLPLPKLSGLTFDFTQIDKLIV